MQIGHSELERGTLKSFKANEVIVREGDYGDCMYIVKSGRVRISKSVMGEDKVLAELGSGQFFGELSSSTIKTVLPLSPWVMSKLLNSTGKPSRTISISIPALLDK